MRLALLLGSWVRAPGAYATMSYIQVAQAVYVQGVFVLLGRKCVIHISHFASLVQSHATCLHGFYILYFSLLFSRLHFAINITSLLKKAS
jgi:hypothetical protein